MMTNDILADLEAADPAGRRQILRELPATHDAAMLGVIARCLADPSPAVCEAAVQALTRGGGRAAAEAAALRLRAAEPAERGYAMDALIRLGSAAIPTMATLLADPDRDVRKYAAEALACVGDETALAALVVLLQDEDVTVAAAAAEALGLLRLPAAIPALAEMAHHGADWARIAAIYSLGEIGGRVALAHICATPPDAPEPVLAVAVEAAGRAAHADPARAVAFLAGLLGHHRSTLRDLALSALGPILAGRPLPDLAESMRGAILEAARQGLRSRDARVRAASARCVGSQAGSDNAEARLLLTELLASEPVTAVRLAILQALAWVGGQPTAPLAELAGSTVESVETRLAALRLIAEQGAPTETSQPGPDYQRLLTALATGAEQPVIRAGALRVLFEMVPSAVEQPGLEVLDDEGVQEDEQAVAELLACPAPARLALASAALGHAEHETRRWAFTTLLPIIGASEIRAADGGRALLTDAARDDDWAIRAHTSRLLQHESGRWARDIARAACADSDGRVRVRAVETLASLPCDEADEQRLRGCLADASGWVRVAALGGLTGFGRVDEASLESALADPFPPMRRTALQAALTLDDGLGSALRRQAARAACAATLDDDPEIARLGQALTSRLG